MRSEVQRDFDWQRQFIPQMKRIVGEHLISEADPAEDRAHNTDLIVLRLDAIRVACRVRQHRYLEAYGDQFTIRVERPTGIKTELAKVIEGWGDYLLYAFAAAGDTALCRWMLIDLRVFRLWLFSHMARHNGALPGEQMTNGDGTKFRAFTTLDGPAGLVSAQQFTDSPQLALVDDPYDHHEVSPWA